MKLRILIALLLIILVSPIRVCSVTNEEIKLQEDERTLSQHLKYRFIEKDTYDIVDYIILIVIILLIIFVIVLLNEKTYVYTKSDSVFLDEEVHITKTIPKDK